VGQTKAIHHALKTALRANGYTYADVAQVLDLSEASVKRLFSDFGFSLQRLEAVCQMIGMEVTDLISSLESNNERLQCLTHEQEDEIASDIVLTLVTVCVLNRWTFEQILDNFKIDFHDCIRKLAHLDRLNLIELMPGNRIKLKISNNFKWLENGPIQKLFCEKVAADYFAREFNRPNEKLIVVNGMFQAASAEELHQRMSRLADDFNELSSRDAVKPLGERKGLTLVLAARGWRYGVFEPYRKPGEPGY
jgi:transcriptional regulator with XRE-family HTH domain